MVAIGRVVVLADREGDPTARVIGAELASAGAEVAVTNSAVAAAESIQHESVNTLVVSGSDLSIIATLRDAASRRQRTVSVVAVVDDASGADAALGAGADSVLVRPVESERLVEAVTRLA